MAAARALEDLNALALPALFAELAGTGLVRRLFELARDEDLAPPLGDITTRVWSPAEERVRARLVVREAGVVAGLEAAPMLLEILSPGARLEARAVDGAAVKRGDELAVIEGPTAEVLALERTLLNVVGRLSGVATLTAEFVRRVPTGARCRVMDTRKTTPGMRVLEKYAVRCGGGFCHRLGLHDAVLVKDNHVAAVPLKELAAHAERAAERARRERALRFVEIEVDTLAQLEELLRVRAGVIDIILLDNMEAGALRRAVALRDERRPGLLLEASGGVTLETIGAIAGSGVDRVSVGGLTHGARWLDVGLDV
ncbi:MAG: carboxylating nicotinate-nucleotide diphosphorylase [Planctomycetota bacterium]|nr:carboxylating nicotinate-nucleotide diphosphorylase [Planctomycetota bacterium]